MIDEKSLSHMISEAILNLKEPLTEVTKLLFRVNTVQTNTMAENFAEAFCNLLGEMDSSFPDMIATAICSQIKNADIVGAVPFVTAGSPTAQAGTLYVSGSGSQGLNQLNPLSLTLT